MKHLAHELIVKPGSKIKLDKLDPGDTFGYDKKDADEHLTKNLERLSVLQYMLYAEGKRSLLVVLQGIDAGGKDGTIKHVMSGLNPQGVNVTSFKVPEGAEKRHDYLWRIHQAVPEWGKMGIFNRSHYEDVLVVRVHDLVPKKVWSERYGQINDFERMLSDSGVHIVKFLLYISKEEQEKRFKERIDDKQKNWKFSPADLKEREYWHEYQQAYEDMIRETSSKEAPWYVVPADHKWFTHLVVAAVVIETLESLGMTLPEISSEQRKEIEKARKLLKG